MENKAVERVRAGQAAAGAVIGLVTDDAYYIGAANEFTAAPSISTA